jgi:hypothetical protein
MPMNAEEIMKLTKGLGLTALVVGSVVVAKRHYNNWQLHNWAVTTTKEINRRYDNCFTIDRLIDANCVDGKTLAIGINGNDNPDNILSKQGIRLGQYGDIKRLVSFIKADNTLVYNFEDNTRLTLTKNDKNNKIIYSFETPGKTVVKEMDDLVFQMYKTIGMASSELDRIVELKANTIKADTIKANTINAGLTKQNELK